MRMGNVTLGASRERFGGEASGPVDRCQEASLLGGRGGGTMLLMETNRNGKCPRGFSHFLHRAGGPAAPCWLQPSSSQPLLFVLSKENQTEGLLLLM